MQRNEQCDLGGRSAQKLKCNCLQMKGLKNMFFRAIPKRSSSNGKFSFAFLRRRCYIEVVGGFGRSFLHYNGVNVQNKQTALREKGNFF